MAIATRLTLEEFTAIPGFDEQRLELIDEDAHVEVDVQFGRGGFTGHGSLR